MFTTLNTRVRAFVVVCILLVTLASSASTTYALPPAYFTWYTYYSAPGGGYIGYEIIDDCANYHEIWGDRSIYYTVYQTPCSEGTADEH